MQARLYPTIVVSRELYSIATVYGSLYMFIYIYTKIKFFAIQVVPCCVNYLMFDSAMFFLYNVRPPSDVSWLTKAPVTLVISIINHSDIGVMFTNLDIERGPHIVWIDVLFLLLIQSDGISVETARQRVRSICRAAWMMCRVLCQRSGPKSWSWINGNLHRPEK